MLMKEIRKCISALVEIVSQWWPSLSGCVCLFSLHGGKEANVSGPVLGICTRILSFYSPVRPWNIVTSGKYFCHSPALKNGDRKIRCQIEGSNQARILGAQFITLAVCLLVICSYLSHTCRNGGTGTSPDSPATR